MVASPTLWIIELYLLPISPIKNLHFPGSLKIRHSLMTKFWPIKISWSWVRFSKQLFWRVLTQLEILFHLLPFFLPGMWWNCLKVQLSSWIIRWCGSRVPHTNSDKEREKWSESYVVNPPVWNHLFLDLFHIQEQKILYLSNCYFENFF